MTRAVLLGGTLCDGRIFGKLEANLANPLYLDYSPFSDARHAATALLDSIPPESVGIAFSLGSWVLLEMLKSEPSRFSKIILISGNSHPDAPENAAIRRARVDEARYRGFAALFAKEWPSMLGSNAMGNPSARNLIVSMANAVGHEGHARQCEVNISRPDHRQLAKAPPCPIHVIAGAEDGLCPRERYEWAASGPSSSLNIIEGVGHYAPIEAPAEVLKSIQARCEEALA